MCADGGANRLYDGLPRLLPGMEPGQARAAFLPDSIRGDLDSVRHDVQAFYEVGRASVPARRSMT